MNDSWKVDPAKLVIPPPREVLKACGFGDAELSRMTDEQCEQELHDIYATE